MSCNLSFRLGESVAKTILHPNGFQVTIASDLEDNMSKKPIVALDMPEQEEALTERQQKYLDMCATRKLGFVPNVLQAYAFHSTKFEGFTALYNDLMLGESGLSKLEREMIAVVVSSANHCYYCLTAHGAAVRQLVR